MEQETTITPCGPTTHTWTTRDDAPFGHAVYVPLEGFSRAMIVVDSKVKYDGPVDEIPSDLRQFCP